jgi:uncharacterized protein
MRSKNRYSVLFSFILVFLLTIPAFAEIDVPAKPLNYVVDLAGIISPDADAALNRYLLELEQKTTVQMVILTIKSLEGNPIEDVSIRIAHDKWKLGQKGKDNGILLLVSLQDRRFRFEIGYGLEGILPDGYVSNVEREYLVPYFRQGDYSKGITMATQAIIAKIASNEGVTITGLPMMSGHPAYPSSEGGGRKPSIFEGIFGILFFIVLLYMFIRHPRLFLLLLFANMLGGGRRGGWGGGGGFGGGGFGGGSFGGGGGGGFGGGGASGSW